MVLVPFWENATIQHLAVLAGLLSDFDVFDATMTFAVAVRVLCEPR
jgi:hypothetical protein